MVQNQARSINEHPRGMKRRVFGIIAASAFFVALVMLIVVSTVEIYNGVVKPVLTKNGLTKIFWVGALIAALIPSGYLGVYGCVAFVTLGKRLGRVIYRHRR
jgi:hypothetical protein